ncbi:MAG: bifunctional demethylmenaquinone methyltransferase/2-methoxy-6-polyprenyl-1,4-benzoquinol methylase UbiE [Dysgonamonadaceae bacterium]|jgi:demethylmenaquinone methyltransferase/2-methoxy-6-polyprenyl-1,4-benzoquinol methylase|nr:bifunctional demethylmenaquinone methyltransferase/2-methoxy-6-polyprenyl-1,4-benzoquinol methylase UbiE [Dysgonamonadaceae bacterium]
MPYKAETIVPFSSDDSSKTIQVEQMFDAIAQRYDLLNHTLSFGIDKYWRKKGISALKNLSPRKILDVATGTGDLAMEACRILRPAEILGIDLSEKMMEIGRQKAATAGWPEQIRFEQQNCMQLTLSDNTFDAAIVAFGVRNFENLNQGLQEICRVLRPGGRLMILELTTPDTFPMKQLYRIYSSLIPAIGQVITRNQPACNYLPKSIQAFPQFAEMARILEKNGYSEVRFQKLTMGICGLYLATK